MNCPSLKQHHQNLSSFANCHPKIFSLNLIQGKVVYKSRIILRRLFLLPVAMHQLHRLNAAKQIRRKQRQSVRQIRQISLGVNKRVNQKSTPKTNVFRTFDVNIRGDSAFTTFSCFIANCKLRAFCASSEPDTKRNVISFFLSLFFFFRRTFRHDDDSCELFSSRTIVNT